jgi:hypothetical protein
MVWNSQEELSTQGGAGFAPAPPFGVAYLPATGVTSGSKTVWVN